jgi:MFS family permease
VSTPWSSRLRQPFVTSLVAGFAAFLAYASMYAFRKPFTAASFEGMHFAGVDYKGWLVIAQVLGYMLSKFRGITWIAEMQRQRRAPALAGLIGFAWAALLGFALVPAPWNIGFLFLNGLPLGMVWGVIFGYLEGRRGTELMGALMCASFIVGSGVVKSVGMFLMTSLGVSEFWMPFATGLVFIPPLVLAVAMLERLPPPSADDVAARSMRAPMDASSRRRFLARFLPGIALIVLAYVALTVMRDFRDNFAAEIWADLGRGNDAAVFTQTEVPIALAVLLITACTMGVRDNLRALMLNHALIFGGFGIAVFSTWLHHRGMLDALWWIGASGFGLYLAYVPYNCTFFERMLATFRVTGNVGFVMYIADANGYLGSVGIILLKEFGGMHVSWASFYASTVMALGCTGMLVAMTSALYFHMKARHQGAPLVLAAA